MKTQTKETQQNLTCQDAHRILVEGNQRFVSNLKVQRDLQEQVLSTSHGQYPFAAILSCIDSRVPAELVFDQGIGDIFSIRVAGNIVNTDVLGSMEYACKVAGSKIIVVLGHTKCGAVAAACQHVELGNITNLLRKIKPAIDVVDSTHNKDSTPMPDEDVEQVAIENIKHSIEKIKQESPILKELEANGHIEIIGALYEVSSGQVTFY